MYNREQLRGRDSTVKTTTESGKEKRVEGRVYLTRMPARVGVLVPLFVENCLVSVKTYLTT